MQAEGGDTVVVSRGKTPASSKKDEDSAIHVCWDCNARFTRLEHLKRHITSLHINAPKSHGCEYCGKSFSRRDVLLRHHQSCRAAKEGQSDQTTKPTRRSSMFQADSEQKSKSNQDKRTPGRDCIYRQSSERQLLSPTESNGDPLQLSPGQYSSAMPISPPQHETNLILLQNSNIDPQLRRGSTFENIVEENQNQMNNSSQISQQDYFNPNNITFPPSDNSQAQRSRSSEAQSQDGRRPANKRGRYVSNACITCQKRKVKCSGEATCFQCRSADLQCTYNTGRKRRNTTTAREETRPTQLSKAPPADKWKPEPPMKVSESLKQMMERIASLERECNAFKEHVAFTTFGDADNHNGSSSSNYEPYSDECSPSNSSVTSFPSTEIFHGATNLLEPIEILNRTVVHAPNDQAPMIEDQSGNRSAVTWRDLPKSHNKDLKTLERETRHADIVGLCNSVDIFFSYLNPHYPCLNENEFRSQFQRFLENDPTQSDNADFYQFLALINLIQAEVRILSEDIADSNKVPAWDEFCRAESILSHLTWLGNGNILTIQCLLIKARYLLYIEKADSAYDTMSRIVCLCFKLGLHDQPKWSESVTPFETIMRQRIFWTIFYLERNIAFNCGAPYLIRESDFNVDLPKNLEDSRMFPGQPLPEETPERSNGPYLSGAVKWGRLCSEIWDTVFGVNAQKPTSQEFIASIDARIIYTMSQFPDHLQWDRNIHRLTGTSDVPHYVLRQTIILHLRMNQLRLLLRQETVLNMQYDPQTATQCVAIATSSINAVNLYLSSLVHRPTDRFSSVLYLVGALLPLVCIIVKDDNSSQTRANAIASFKKGLSLLNSMSPNFSWARHTLRRIHRIIGTAKRAIEVFDNAGMFSLDMSEFFEGEMMQPQYTDFFNMDTWTSMEKDGGLAHPADGTTALSFEMHVGNGNGGDVTMDVTNPDFPGTADEMDSFWVEDFLSNKRGVFHSG